MCDRAVSGFDFQSNFRFTVVFIWKQLPDGSAAGNAGSGFVLVGVIRPQLNAMNANSDAAGRRGFVLSVFNAVDRDRAGIGCYRNKTNLTDFNWLTVIRRLTRNVDALDSGLAAAY